MARRRFTWILALAAAFAFVASACGDDESGGATAEPTTESTPDDGGTTTTTGEPRPGGVVTFGQYSPPPGLDPIKLQGGGQVGGIELAAIYDTVVRYNPQTYEYEPRTGEFSANADYTEWTLTLKPGITFGDGTPYDAEAVRFNVERQKTQGVASRYLLNRFLESMTVVDELTLRFDLTEGWVGFPYLFTKEVGHIASPTAIQAKGEQFNTDPGDAGAGPFRVKSFKPGEVLELERNDNFYGGDVYLDGLRFVFLPGPDANYEAIKAGELQAAFVRDPSVVNAARADGYQLVEIPAVAGNMINMNSGVQVTCTGGQPAQLCQGKADGERVPTQTATADVRVRRAVAAAVDPNVVNERVFDGKAKPDSAVFANFPWDPNVPGPEYDPDEARRLVEEAKADGWDGRIRLMAANDPFSKSWAQAVSTMLEQVGMDVDVDTTKGTREIVNQVLVLRDYDLVTWAYGLNDESDGNYSALVQIFNDENPRYGYSNPEMESAVEQLRVAETDEQRTDAYRAIAEIWSRDVPAHVITQITDAVIHSPKLHGVVRSGASNVLLDGAWLEQ